MISATPQDGIPHDLESVGYHNGAIIDYDDLIFDESYAYLTDVNWTYDNVKLQVLDVTNPEYPVIISNTSWSSPAKYMISRMITFT